MAQEGIWAWDDTNKVWRKILADDTGRLLIVATVDKLNDIGDVDVPSPSDGDFIYYDSASGTWKNIAHKDATTGVHGVGALGFKVSSKVLTFDRAMTAASGNVSYTGVGFQPTALICFATILDTLFSSWGFSDSQKYCHCIEQYTSTLRDTALDLIYLMVNGVTYDAQEGVVYSYDTDGFTLTWTKTAFPTGTGRLKFLCLK